MGELFGVYGFYLCGVPGREYFIVLLDSEHVSEVDEVDIGIRGEHVEEIDERVLGEGHVLLVVVLLVVLLVVVFSLDESAVHFLIVFLDGVDLSETGLNGGHFFLGKDMCFTLEGEIVAFLVLAYHDEGAVDVAFELYFPHGIGGDEFFVFLG